MCDPVTLTVIAIAVTVAAGGMKAKGQLDEGQAKANLYNYQASLAIQNARRTKEEAAAQKQLIGETADANITATQISAADESKRQMRDVAELEGAQKAGMGFAGITGGGTAEAIARDTFDKSQMDQLAIRYNANLRSWNISTEAKRNIWVVGEEEKSKVWSLEAEASQYSYAAKYAKKAAKTQAIGTLLETAGMVAFMSGGNFTPSSGGSSVTV